MPSSATRTASQITEELVWRRVVPTARSSPSSWVRSWIESTRLLAMLTRAMIAASASKRVHQVDDLVELCGAGVDVLAPALHLGVRVGAGDGFESLRRGDRDPSPGAAFTYTLTSNWSTPVAAWSA